MLRLESKFKENLSSVSYKVNLKSRSKSTESPMKKTFTAVASLTTAHEKGVTTNE